jgi:hypothetical protein
LSLNPEAPIRWRASWPEDPRTHKTDGTAYAGTEIIGRAYFVEHVHTLHGTGWHWSVTDPRLQHGEIKGQLSGMVEAKEPAKALVEERWRTAVRAGAIVPMYRAEAARRRIEAAGGPSVRQYMDEDREDERFSREV